MSKKPVSMLGYYLPGMKPVSASDLNTFVSAAKMLKRITVEPPLGLHFGENQITFYIKDQFIEMFVGKIVDEGPASEADYDDARYWFKRCICDNAAGDEHTVVSFATLAAAHDDYIHSTVTNLNGIFVPGYHPIYIDSFVVIFAVFDDQDPPIKRYFFWGAIDDPPMHWGRVDTAWAPDQEHLNQVILDPCTSPPGGVDNGLPKVTGYLVSPFENTPSTRGLVFDIAEGDILAYIPFGENKGVIVNAHFMLPAGTTGSLLYMDSEGKWSPLPGTVDQQILVWNHATKNWDLIAKGSMYQVVQARADGKTNFDWVRLHG